MNDESALGKKKKNTNKQTNKVWIFRLNCKPISVCQIVYEVHL